MTATAVSRADGYRLGRPKEEMGVRAIEHFFKTRLDVSLQRINGAEANYLRGDLLAQPWNQSIECKRQPIDPGRYAKNFVEVCEATTNPRHVDGLADLAEILSLSLDMLQGTALGHETHLSVSIRSMTSARMVAYVNPDAPRAHVYLYDSFALLNEIRGQVTNGSLVRGAGQSNDDTFGVFVDNAPARWSAEITEGIDPVWHYTGAGSESLALAGVQYRLIT